MASDGVVWGFRGRDIKDFAAQHREKSPEEVAALMTARCTKRDLLAWATAFIVDLVEGERRSEARAVEDDAQRMLDEIHRERRERVYREEQVLRKARQVADDLAFLPRWHDLGIPVLLDDGDDDLKVVSEWGVTRRDEWSGVVSLRKTKNACMDLLRIPWPEQIRRDSRRSRERHWAKLRKIQEDYAAEIRLEVTAELLGTPFALGDGRSVTWGEATVADHRQRAEMLFRGAAGTLETAARHEAAIRMLDECQARTLSELVAPANTVVAAGSAPDRMADNSAAVT